MNIGTHIPNVPISSGMSTEIFSRAMIRVMALTLILTGVGASWAKSDSYLLREQSLLKLDEVNSTLKKSLAELKRLSQKNDIPPADTSDEQHPATAQGFTKVKPLQRTSLDIPAKSTPRPVDLKKVLSQMYQAITVSVAVWTALMILLFLRPFLAAKILRRNLPEVLDCLTAVRIAFRLIGSYFVLILPMVVSGFVIALYYLPSTKLDVSRLWPMGIIPAIGLITLLLNHPLARLVLWKVQN